MQWTTVIIGALVYAGVVFCFGIFFMFFIRRYRDPDDLPDCFTTTVTVCLSSTSIFSRFLPLQWLTYTLTTAAVLMLPFDVICAPDSHEFMPIIWQIFMAACLVMV